MNGIEAAFEGRIGKQGHVRTSQSGKSWCSVSIVVGVKDEEGTWLHVAAFGDQAEVIATIEKGARVYVEGRLTLNTWKDSEGRERTGLKVAASLVQPIGQIGHRKPARASGKGFSSKRASDLAQRPHEPEAGYGGRARGFDSEIPF